MKTTITLCSLLYILALVTGCNTVEGVGKDFKKAGESIEESATSTKRKIETY